MNIKKADDWISFYCKNANNPNNMSSWLIKVKKSGFRIPETVIIPMEDELDYLCSLDAYGCSDDQEAEKAYTQRTIAKIISSGFPTECDLFVKAGTFSWKNIFFYPHVTKEQGIMSIPGKFARIFISTRGFSYKTGAEMIIREFIHTDYNRPTVLSGQKLNPELRMVYDFDTHSIIGTYPYFQEVSFGPWLPHPTDEYVPGWIDPVDGLYELHQTMPVLEAEFHQLRPALEAEAKTKLKTVPLSDTWYIDFLYDGHDFWLVDMSLLSSVTWYDRGFFNFPSFD